MATKGTEGAKTEVGIWGRELAAVRAALMFFTRVPVPSARHNPEDLQRAAAWFPLVGWLVGAVAAGVWWAAVQVWPPMCFHCRRNPDATLPCACKELDGGDMGLPLIVSAAAPVIFSCLPQPSGRPTSPS